MWIHDSGWGSLLGQTYDLLSKLLGLLNVAVTPVVETLQGHSSLVSVCPTSIVDSVRNSGYQETDVSGPSPGPDLGVSVSKLSSEREPSLRSGKT